MKIPCKYERLEDCSKEDLINKIMVRDKHCCDLKELLDKGLKKYKELEKENKKLKENIAWYEKEEDRLREGNRKLKSDLAFKNTMLDNVKAEYENLQEINENLKERIKELEK